MNTYRPRFIATTEEPFGLRFTNWLAEQLKEVPPKFRQRYHGPVLALPRFMHKWVGYPVPAYPLRDGYELAAILFFPDTAGLHAGAVYRIEFEFDALDYETTKTLGDGTE